jgi:hypothetical protein
MTQTVEAERSDHDPNLLTQQQVAYFEMFGFLRVPGLFANEIGEITAAFEQVFDDERNYRMETYADLHAGQRRLIVPVFIDRHPTLNRLRADPKVLGIVKSLIGERFEYAESDGNLFYCESSWHPDVYGAALTRYHIKLSFYLDPLAAETGAIRMIPGTNHYQSPFARALRTMVFERTPTMDALGIAERDIPSWTIASNPGDVIVWNYRTLHASYNGGERRRLFSISFREPEETPE